MDGNHEGTEQPQVSIVGDSRSAIFDTSETDDDAAMLPDKSINNVEMYNEAGVGSRQTTSGFVTINEGDPYTTIKSRLMNFPSDGYAVCARHNDLYPQPHRRA